MAEVMRRFLFLLLLLSGASLRAQNVTLTLGRDGVRLASDDLAAPARLLVPPQTLGAPHRFSDEVRVEVETFRYRFDGQRVVVEGLPEAAQMEPSMRMDFMPVRARVGWGFVDTAPMEAALRYNVAQEDALEAATFVLAAEIRSLAPGDARRARLVEQLKSQVASAFALKQANRLQEIELLELELRNLRAQHHRREEARERLIDQRLRQLTGEKP